MFFRNALASILHLFGVFSFGAAGIVSLCLYYSPSARVKAIEGLFAHPELALTVGLIFWAICLLMTLGFFSLHRGKYLRLKMGTRKVDVDISVVQTAIEKCLKAHGNEATLIGIIAGAENRLEVEIQAQEVFAKKLEGEITTLLQKKLGLLNPFYLTVRSTAKDSLDPSE